MNVTDRRKEWLQAAVDTFEWDLLLKVAAVLCKYTGTDGVCEQTRRTVTAEAGIDKDYDYQRAMRELEESGFIYRENPGTPSRTTARYSLVLDGTFINGGDIESAPRLASGRGWAWRIQKNSGRRETNESVKPLSRDDPIWLELMPYCGHTLRTCNPECSEWGGRPAASNFGLIEGFDAA